MTRIDLNADLAEGFPDDGALLGIVTSANVCCGAHAGSPALTWATLRACHDRGVRVGLHPGYPERQWMGRRTPPSIERLPEALIAQVEPFLAARPAYLKPHGALYNDSTVPGRAADVLAALLAAWGLPLLGLPGTEHTVVARRAGVPFISEGFVDRGYHTDGRLIPRGEPGAVLTDPESQTAQAVRLAGRVDSLCLHGDGADAVATALRVRAALEANGYEVGT